MDIDKDIEELQKATPDWLGDWRGGDGHCFLQGRGVDKSRPGFIVCVEVEEGSWKCFESSINPNQITGVGKRAVEAWMDLVFRRLEFADSQASLWTKVQMAFPVPDRQRKGGAE